MPQAAYPTAADLLTYLEEGGLTPPSSRTLAIAISAGIADFERRTGRTMLAGGSETRTLTPDAVTREGRIVLPWDVAVLTSVGFQPFGGTLEPWTAGTHYFTKPDGAPSNGQPISMLDLGGSYGGPLPFSYNGALQFTGRFGYGTTIPDDAWLAMIQLGAKSLSDRLQFQRSGGVQKWSAGTVSETYADFGAQMGANAEMTIKRYVSARVLI